MPDPDAMKDGQPGGIGSGDSTGPEPSGDEGPDRAPGWRDVLLVSAAVVGFVLGAALLTSLLPESLQDLVFKTPLAIVVLIVGTVGLLIRISTRRPG